MQNKPRHILKNIIKCLNVLGFIAIFAFLFWAWREGLFTTEDRFLIFMSQFGSLAPLVFYVLQIIQTIIPIIPGALTIPLGIIMFGDFWGFIHNLIPILIGSILNFYLARYYGRRLVHILVGDKNYQKAMSWLDEPKIIDRAIILGLTLPFMPADLICYVAGLSTKEFSNFLIVLMIGKPISILLYAYGTLFILESIINLF